MKKILFCLFTMLCFGTVYATGIQYCYTLAGTWTGTALSDLGDTVVLTQSGTTVSGTWTQHGSGCVWNVSGTFVNGSVTPYLAMTGGHGGTLCANFNQLAVIQLGTPGCQSVQVNTGYHSTVILTSACVIPSSDNPTPVGPLPYVAQATFKSTLGNGSYNFGGRSIQSVPTGPAGGSCLHPPLALNTTQYLFVDSTNSYTESIGFAPGDFQSNWWAHDLPCDGTYTETLNIDCTDGHRSVNGGGEPDDGGGLVWTQYATPGTDRTMKDDVWAFNPDNVGRSTIQKGAAIATGVIGPGTFAMEWLLLSQMAKHRF